MPTYDTCFFRVKTLPRCEQNYNRGEANKIKEDRSFVFEEEEEEEQLRPQ